MSDDDFTQPARTLAFTETQRLAIQAASRILRSYAIHGTPDLTSTVEAAARVAVELSTADFADVVHAHVGRHVSRPLIEESHANARAEHAMRAWWPPVGR